MQFVTKAFSELSLEELYDSIQLREAVFVVEQNCPYLDADGKDQASFHLMGKIEGKILAYARLVPKGVSYADYPSIGRIVTAASVRRDGYGKKLVQAAIAEIDRIWGKQSIKISAQQYLLKFYQGLGFQEVGEGYLEDDIPHIAMVYKQG